LKARRFSSSRPSFQNRFRITIRDWAGIRFESSPVFLASDEAGWLTGACIDIKEISPLTPEQRVYALGDVEFRWLHSQVVASSFTEIKEPAEIGDPVGRQALKAARFRVVDVAIGERMPLVPEKVNNKSSVAIRLSRNTRFH
jgi:hypothetical protein